MKCWTWLQAVGWSGTHATVSFDYDLDGRPVAIEDLDERALVWDPASRLIAVDDASDASRSQLYGYDPLDRLTSADIGAWLAPQTYGYDAVGNRTSHTDDATGNGWQYAYGLNHNRLTSRWPVVGGTPGTVYASSYDAMGNLVADGLGLNLSYDATGRLVQGSKGLAQQTSSYNALGQRVSRTVVGGAQTGTQLYAYDEQGRPLGVYAPDASEPTGFRVVEEYVHLDGWRPVAVVRPNAASGMANPDIHPILTDHLGTPRKVLDASTGQARWEWDAKEPFGHQVPNEIPTAGFPAFAFDLRFPGQRYDEATGLFQNGFRDYHAGLGRYVQSDPLGLEAGWNTYGYVDGNPLRYTDPLGLVRRDSQGKVIQEEQGAPWKHCEQDKCVTWQTVLIYTDKGRPVAAYKYLDGFIGYKQNCHAYALGINLWIDNPTEIYDEEYSRVALPQPGDITFYQGGWLANPRSPSHSSIYMKDSMFGPVNHGKRGKQISPAYEHHWWTRAFGGYSPVHLRKKQ